MDLDIEQKNRGIMWLAIILLVVAFIAAVLIFNNDNPGATGSWQAKTTLRERPPRLYTVSYVNGIFSPTNLRVRVDDSVAFRNKSSATIKIIPDAEDAEIVGFTASGDLVPNAVFTHLFLSAGVFNYANANSPGEQGTVTVEL